MRTLKQYTTFWLIIAGNALQEVLVNRWTSALFFIGKSVRLIMSLVFMFLIKHQVSTLSGYTGDEIVIFFLSYQFLDTLVQILYRGVYVFDYKVRTGEFDFYLINPINPLFRALLGKPDFSDVVFFIPSTLISVYIASTLQITVTLGSLVGYILLLFNGLLIATGLHILVLCLGVVASEVQSAIWFYRDVSRLSQFPVTIYFELIRFALFFIIPVGAMMTIPSEVLLGRTPSLSLVATVAIGAGFFLGSLRVWQKSLRKYNSASS